MYRGTRESLTCVLSAPNPNVSPTIVIRRRVHTLSGQTGIRGGGQLQPLTVALDCISECNVTLRGEWIESNHRKRNDRSIPVHCGRHFSVFKLLLPLYLCPTHHIVCYCCFRGSQTTTQYKLPFTYRSYFLVPGGGGLVRIPLLRCCIC